VPISNPSINSSDSVSISATIHTTNMPPPPTPAPPQPTSLSTTLGPTTATGQLPPTTVSPGPRPPSQASAREAHLQRTNDRFRNRISQLQTENEALRQAGQVNRTHLSRAHVLLEEVLAAEGLELRGEVYEVLAEVGQLISGCVSGLGRL
jgi:hypothetical protein